ncbi:Protein kinase-like domain [Pseudocohnilembus persalinus]|uniref:Protein kinase-like domain n=1 Tax=Pseudocohnilembus persalinus TaxID=266149 RepID=A0A0V0QKJ1_PSEPJ|nr:Protein kinase-like domain [Pseudocohnilembus persalinus]|eukprot:KRX02634.1 Protein kinase-like domain [Pseudocohnilembus persalinus]
MYLTVDFLLKLLNNNKNCLDIQNSAKNQNDQDQISLKNSQEIDLLNKKKLIVQQNVEEYKNVPLEDIILQKLTGLTNETFKVSHKFDQKKKYVLRIFGKAEGLVQPEKENKIFVSLGEQELGPKCIAVEVGVWRIEEFIDNGIHPDVDQLKVPFLKYLLAIYISRFHQSNIDLDEKPLTQRLLNNDNNIFENFQKKSDNKQLFTESELTQVQELQQIISTEWIEYLKQIQPQGEEFNFIGHNDINQFNIFYSDTKEIGQQIQFIDFEYCSKNYAGYDIANFLNECCIDYAVDKFPFFVYREDKELNQDEIHQFTRIYLISLKYPKQSFELEKLVIENKNLSQKELDDIINEFIYNILAQSSFNEKYQFEDDINNLVQQINACRIM